MSGGMSWLLKHGFELIESIGVIAGLFVSAAALRASSKITKAENLVRVTESHRALWLYYSDHPNLKRILQRHVDLSKHPVTKAEHRFMILLIAHVVMAFKTNQAHLKTKPEGQDQDVGELFSMPIPQQVWREVRHLQDRDVVAYVEECSDRWKAA